MKQGGFWTIWRGVLKEHGPIHQEPSRPGPPSRLWGTALCIGIAGSPAMTLSDSDVIGTCSRTHQRSREAILPDQVEGDTMMTGIINSRGGF